MRVLNLIIITLTLHIGIALLDAAHLSPLQKVLESREYAAARQTPSLQGAALEKLRPTHAKASRVAL